MIEFRISGDLSQIKLDLAELVDTIFPAREQDPQPVTPVATPAASVPPVQQQPPITAQEMRAPVNPIQQKAPTAPVATKPTVKLADLQQAVGIFCETGQAARQSILSTLQAYGVQALTQLTPEQLEDFANRVRAMGAKI